MAEPLKNLYGPDVPPKIAGQIKKVWPAFPSDKFIKDCLRGYGALALTQRARHMAAALKTHLPADFPRAAQILTRSLGPKIDKDDVLGIGMSVFIYLPHVFYTAQHGGGHFEEALALQHALTQRFSAEYSIRTFLEKYPAQTLARLKLWARDKSAHVRRLVSEGTRPRLPWAGRLKQFQKDPRPVIELLDMLKDDPSPYVRRSVANNLNDIGKDNPDVLIDTARRWLKNAPAPRQKIVRNALRSLVKAGRADALALLGYGGAAQVKITRATAAPARAKIGGKITVQFHLENAGATPENCALDFKIHYVKSSGKTSAKVFKLKGLRLAPGQTISLSKSISLAEMTTRKHFPGPHKVEAILNGRPLAETFFHLTR
jgi:3-methyladenine DNA glycosylase AlkC